MAIKGYEQLRLELERLVTNCNNPQWLYEAGEYVQRQAIYKAPFHNGELWSSIGLEMNEGEDGLEAVVYTDNDHAIFVEHGTGPKGAANHAGISPNVTPTYKATPWGIPQGSISDEDAKFYRMPKHIVNGKTYYKTAGQAAQPYMYPALADNIDMVIEIADKGFDEAMKGIK